MNYELNKINVIVIWQPYDDNTITKYAHSQSNLSMISSLIKERSGPVIIMGDFNSDTNRQKRFDNDFKKFIVDNKLSKTHDLYNNNDHTYRNGSYTSQIDHILLNDIAKKIAQSSNIINSYMDLSDHKPVDLLIRVEKPVWLNNENDKF